MPVDKLSYHPDRNATSLRALVERALSGDERAFEGIHDRLNGGLKAFLQRRTRGHGELVEELSQRVWVEAWRSLDQRRYDPDRAAFTTFLYAIAYNVFLRHCRSEGQRGQRQAFSLDGPGGLTAAVGDVLGQDEDHGEILHGAELLDALRDCMGQLATSQEVPEIERAILARVAQGESERLIAGALEIAPSTVNARKQSALQRIRHCLRRKGFLDREA